MGKEKVFFVRKARERKVNCVKSSMISDTISNGRKENLIIFRDLIWLGLGVEKTEEKVLVYL